MQPGPFPGCSAGAASRSELRRGARTISQAFSRRVFAAWLVDRVGGWERCDHCAATPALTARSLATRRTERWSPLSAKRFQTHASAQAVR